jgi:hypothetical protein
MDQEKELRMQIKRALSRITPANSPSLYAEIFPKHEFSRSGYSRVETRIIERAVETGLSIDAIIPQLEQESELM